MSIEFGDAGAVEMPGAGPVVGSEFAQVSVKFDVAGNSPRLRLEDLRTGRVRYLDALELEAMIWLPEERLTELLDPSAGPLAGRRMKRAAIVCPLRTAVGAFGGTSASAARRGPGCEGYSRRWSRAAAVDPELPRRRRLRAVLRQLRGAVHRSVGGAARRPADRAFRVCRLDRRCGGGLQAVITAAMMVQTGAADVVLAGGVEIDEQYRALHHHCSVGLAVRQPDALRPPGSRPRMIAADLAIRRRSAA